MAGEDSHEKSPATTKVCTTSRFGSDPLENQGLQRHKTSKIGIFVSQFAKSGYVAVCLAASRRRSAVLDPLDKEIERRGHHHARYADELPPLRYAFGLSLRSSLSQRPPGASAPNPMGRKDPSEFRRCWIE